MTSLIPALRSKKEPEPGKEEDAEETSLLAYIAATVASQFTDSRKLETNRQLLVSLGFFLGATYLFHFQRKQFDL